MDILIIYILIVNYIFCLTSENTIYSLFWLIFFFFNCFLLLFIFDIKIISVLILIIYVGTIAVLFIFSIMILNFSKKIKDFNNSSIRFLAKGNSIIGYIFITITFLIFLLLLVKFDPSVVHASNCNSYDGCDLTHFLSLLDTFTFKEDYTLYETCLERQREVIEKIVIHHKNSSSAYHDETECSEMIKLIYKFNCDCKDILIKFKNIKK